MFKELFQDAKNDLKAVANSAITKVAAIGTVVAGTMATAHAEVTLPTTGLDVGEYVSAGIVALAGVFGTILGGWMVFLIVKKSMKASGKALG